MYIQNKPLYQQEIEAERQGIENELFAAAGEGVRRGGRAAAACRCNSIWIISPGMENWLILTEGSQGWVRQLGEETGRERGRLLSVRAGGKQRERVVIQDQKIFLIVSYHERCAGRYSSSFFTQLCSGSSLYLCSDWAYSWEGNTEIWLSQIDNGGMPAITQSMPSRQSPVIAEAGDLGVTLPLFCCSKRAIWRGNSKNAVTVVIQFSRLQFVSWHGHVKQTGRGGGETREAGNVDECAECIFRKPKLQT